MSDAQFTGPTPQTSEAGAKQNALPTQGGNESPLDATKPMPPAQAVNPPVMAKNPAYDAASRQASQDAQQLPRHSSYGAAAGFSGGFRTDMSPDASASTAPYLQSATTPAPSADAKPTCRASKLWQKIVAILLIALMLFGAFVAFCNMYCLTIYNRSTQQLKRDIQTFTQDDSTDLQQLLDTQNQVDAQFQSAQIFGALQLPYVKDHIATNTQVSKDLTEAIKKMLEQQQDQDDSQSNSNNSNNGSNGSNGDSSSDSSSNGQSSGSGDQSSNSSGSGDQSSNSSGNGDQSQSSGSSGSGDQSSNSSGNGDKSQSSGSSGNGDQSSGSSSKNDTSEEEKKLDSLRNRNSTSSGGASSGFGVGTDSAPGGTTNARHPW
ncbi:MAG: DUF6466 family protein [Bifidobacteriaceae bacterium]|nr:DUF6466 family protein [Bifidobacteriaceae bacterium]